jgi:hypothetical protein
MRSKSLFLVAAAGAAVLLSAGVLSACGDKFVVLGRATRFGQMRAAAHPASILIYNNPASRIPAAEKEYRLATTLRSAGHRPLVLQDRVQLEEAVASRDYDVVLADIADADAIEQVARAASPGTVVVPVLYNPSGAELAGAERQYSCVLKASRKNDDLLSVIDEAMKSKAKGVAANCPKPK